MTYIEERRQEEKEQRRKDILNAAERMIASQGLNKTSLGQIAREARLSRPLIYTYFKDKEDLYCGILERGLVLLHRQLTEAIASYARGINKMVAINRAYVQFSQRHTLNFDALAHFEAQDIDPANLQPNQAACLEAGRRVHQLMADVISGGVADGSIRAGVGDPMLTAVTMWGFIHGLIQLRARKGTLLSARYDIDDERLMRHGLELAARSIAQ